VRINEIIKTKGIEKYHEKRVDPSQEYLKNPGTGGRIKSRSP
jgi:hypothetical protein